MSAPWASVVVVSWGGSESLLEALALAGEQAAACDAELLLVLNCSREQVDPAFLARCETLVDRVVFEELPGKSRALNRAAREAFGEVVAFLDDDALPEPGWLEELLAPLSSDPACAGVGGRVLPVLPTQGVPYWYRRLCRGRPTYFLGPRHDLGDAPRDYAPGAYATLPLGANCAWRRALLLEVGYAEDLGPNRETGTRGGEDALLARTLLDRGHRVTYAPRAIVRHPVTPARLTPDYVLEGYYWQGVEKARIQRHLGLPLSRRLRLRALRRVIQASPFALLEPVLPRTLAVNLLKRRQFNRGWLDEVRGRVPQGRPLALLLALACLLLAAACGREPRVSAAGKPNVLLVVVDTLRADHLSCYGYGRSTSPVLDAFAAQAVRFEDAWAQAPRTVASHASLFTSTYPAVHRAWNAPHPDDEDDSLPALSPQAITLAEVLQAAGYDTAAFCDGGWLQRSRGLAQGFETFQSRFLGVSDRVSAAIDWLERRDPDGAPFLLFVHTYEVHTPWLPEPALVEEFAPSYQGRLRGVLAEARAHAASEEVSNPLVDTHRRFFEPILPELEAEDVDFVRALYDAEIRKVDRELGRLWARLQALDLADDTLVVVTSDHGEEFAEHGRWEHVQVYDECLRVPLIVRLPGQREGRVRRDPVELVDVMPTLLAELGLRIPEAAQGRTLDLRAEGGEPAERERWAESNEPHPQVAWRRGANKVVLHAGSEWRAEVFDLGSDPLEGVDLAGHEGSRELAAEVLQRLGTWRRDALEHARAFRLEPIPSSRDAFEASQIDELRALGYVR